LRLLDYLARRFRYLDAEHWRREIDAGALKLDGQRVDQETPVHAGQRLAYERRQPEPPVATDVQVVHRERGFVVVAKPAHLPVHGDGTFVRHTLVHQLGRLLQCPVHLVHRLDRETSGLLVVACTAAARQQLETQFRAGGVDKAYLAVVDGPVRGDFVADGPIGRDPGSAITLRRAVVPDGTPARTEVTVLRSGARHSLVRCVPRTGRTHQIRVHLCAAGHPVAGDKLYGRSDAEYLAFVRHVKAGGSPRAAAAGPDRQLLHAAELAFRHPDGGAPLAFRAPMPDDMGAWVTRLCGGPAADASP
jgi:RluA family pseudouridine synthase